MKTSKLPDDIQALSDRLHSSISSCIANNTLLPLENLICLDYDAKAQWSDTFKPFLSRERIPVGIYHHNYEERDVKDVKYAINNSWYLRNNSSLLSSYNTNYVKRSGPFWCANSEEKYNLIFFSLGGAYECELSINRDVMYNLCSEANRYGPSRYLDADHYVIKDVSLGEWKHINKLKDHSRMLQISEQSDSAIKDLFKLRFPYSTDMNLGNLSMKSYLMCPYLETLNKAGYSFVFSLRLSDDACIESFNRLCKPGTSPKTIFKTSKMVFNMLKEETSLVKWDAFRKMYKTGRISDKDTLYQLYQSNLSDKEISKMYTILGRKYNGHSIFTFDSLFRYLERIDRFEAIEKKDGLQILDDYLVCCQSLNMEPKIDGDSLKREHDIAARLCRIRRDEKLASDMKDACKYLEKYNYDEPNSPYFIRGIRDYDDLLDEARQQHNCVAGYARGIIKGDTRIYVLRQKKNPDSSLVTIELSPDGKTIRQKYLAYNRSISNNSITEFINRWGRFCREGGRKEESVSNDIESVKSKVEQYCQLSLFEMDDVNVDETLYL